MLLPLQSPGPLIPFCREAWPQHEADAVVQEDEAHSHPSASALRKPCGRPVLALFHGRASVWREPSEEAERGRGGDNGFQRMRVYCLMQGCKGEEMAKQSQSVAECAATKKGTRARRRTHSSYSPSLMPWSAPGAGFTKPSGGGENPSTEHEVIPLPSTGLPGQTSITKLASIKPNGREGTTTPPQPSTKSSVRIWPGLSCDVRSERWDLSLRRARR